MCFVSTALDKGNFFAPCSCAITKCGCSEEEKAKRKNEATLSARIISNRKTNVSNNSKGKSIICTYIEILKQLLEYYSVGTFYALNIFR